MCFNSPLHVCPAQLRGGRYRSTQEWHADLALIWQNALTYNGEDHKVTKQALKLQSVVQQRMDAGNESTRGGKGGGVAAAVGHIPRMEQMKTVCLHPANYTRNVVIGTGQLVGQAGHCTGVV